MERRRYHPLPAPVAEVAEALAHAPRWRWPMNVMGIYPDGRLVEVRGAEAWGPDLVPFLPDDWAFNFGFSAAGKPVESVTLTAAARNLLETNYRDTERSLEIGARFDPGKYLGIEVNTVAPLVKGVDWTMVGWHVGADIGIADVIALRGGFVADDGETYGCGGLGFLSERAILDYGMRVQVSDAKRTWHQLDLTVKF